MGKFNMYRNIEPLGWPRIDNEALVVCLRHINYKRDDMEYKEVGSNLIIAVWIDAQKSWFGNPKLFKAQQNSLPH